MGKLFRVNKNDIALILFIIFVAMSFYLYKYFSSSLGNTICIYVDNELYGQYNLDDSEKVEIHNDDIVCNTICIHNGKVFMESASCPDKLCVNQQSISLVGESICCLPNKVIITIESNNEGEYDAIVK